MSTQSAIESQPATISLEAAREQSSHEGGLFWKIKHMLVCTDFSPASEAALEAAVLIWQRTKARVSVLHVCEFGPIPATTDEGLDEIDRMYAEQNRQLKAAVKQLRDSGIKAEAVGLDGNAPTIILEEIERTGVDLVVMGTRATKGVERLVFGSTAEAVFRKATCPVLTAGIQSLSAVTTATGRPILYATDFHENSDESASAEVSCAVPVMAALMPRTDPGPAIRRIIVLFLWESYSFKQPAMRKAYSMEYLRATVGAQSNQHGSFRLLTLAGPSIDPRLAVPADFVPGRTLLPGGASVPIMLSAAARANGYDVFYRAPARSYPDASMHRWLRDAIFDGDSLLGAYAWPLGESAAVLVLALAYSVPRDLRRLRELKYGRRLKGPVMHDARAFNKIVKGDGIGIQTADARTVLRIPRVNEAQHLEIIGDTGSGKTTLIMQLLQQIKARGESAIVYDPACEFVQRFYDQGRGDVILNPLDARCPYWGPAEELRRKAEAKAIAASLYQPTSDKKGEFFTETPQKIFAHLLTYGPTPQELVEWMSNPAEIDRRVKGTELASIVEPGAQQQRAGVLASLGLIADSLRMLPTREQADGQSWSATQWAEKRQGWIFITSQATEREALRPLHSLWIDLLVLRLLNAPTPEQRPVWFVLDELASLQRLPQLHTAITENRKSKNPLILGFQGKAQLETIYGHLAEVMLSQPATKIFLKTTEPKAAEWVSKAIGNVEIERMRESHVHGTREGKSFTIDRQTEPLVMDSEVAGLPDKHAFLKLGNNVARFSFAYCSMPAIAPDFRPRSVHDDELTFDPLTLRPRFQAPPPVAPQIEPDVVLLQDPDDETVLTPANDEPTPFLADSAL